MSVHRPDSNGNCFCDACEGFDWEGESQAPEDDEAARAADEAEYFRAVAEARELSGYTRELQAQVILDASVFGDEEPF